MTQVKEENQIEVATPDQANSQIVSVETDGQQVVYNPMTVAEKLMSGASGNFITTIANDGNRATHARIFNAINDNDGNVSDMINQTLDVVDLMAFPVQIADLKTGELQEGIRVVLITKDGESYGSVAKGVFSSLQNIIAICGMGPWQDGIRLTPVQKKTRAGFTTLTFRMEA